MLPIHYVSVTSFSYDLSIEVLYFVCQDISIEKCYEQLNYIRDSYAEVSEQKLRSLLTRSSFCYLD